MKLMPCHTTAYCSRLGLQGFYVLVGPFLAPCSYKETHVLDNVPLQKTKTCADSRSQPCSSSYRGAGQPAELKALNLTYITSGSGSIKGGAEAQRITGTLKIMKRRGYAWVWAFGLPSVCSMMQLGSAAEQKMRRIDCWCQSSHSTRVPEGFPYAEAIHIPWHVLCSCRAAGQGALTADSCCRVRHQSRRRQAHRGRASAAASPPGCSPPSSLARCSHSPPTHSQSPPPAEEQPMGVWTQPTFPRRQTFSLAGLGRPSPAAGPTRSGSPLLAPHLHPVAWRSLPLASSSSSNRWVGPERRLGRLLACKGLRVQAELPGRVHLGHLCCLPSCMFQRCPKLSPFHTVPPSPQSLSLCASAPTAAAVLFSLDAPLLPPPPPSRPSAH